MEEPESEVYVTKMDFRDGENTYAVGDEVSASHMSAERLAVLEKAGYIEHQRRQEEIDAVEEATAAAEEGRRQRLQEQTTPPPTLDDEGNPVPAPEPAEPIPPAPATPPVDTSGTPSSSPDQPGDQTTTPE